MESQITALLLPYILTINRDAFVRILLLLNEESQLALAKTCRKLHRYYQSIIVTMILPSLRYQSRHNPSYFRLIKTYLNPYGWLHLRYTIASELQLQREDPPIQFLCLGQELEFPNDSDCAHVHAILIRLFSREILNSSIYFPKFANLGTFVLEGVPFNDNMAPMFSSLASVKFIILHGCNLTQNGLSAMFTECTTLIALQLIRCTHSKGTTLKPPTQLKSLKIFGSHNLTPMDVDASNCTQLHCCAIKSHIMSSWTRSLNAILPLKPCLRELSCDFDLNSSGSFESSLVNLKTLTLLSGSIYCYKTFLSPPLEWKGPLAVRHRYFDFSKWIHFRNLEIMHPSIRSYELNCTLPKGKGYFYVTLFWKTEVNPIPTVLRFELIPQETTDVSIQLKF
jgi:hypothetical protein